MDQINRWCKKKECWRSVKVCEWRAIELNIKECRECLNDYRQLSLPFKINEQARYKRARRMAV